MASVDINLPIILTRGLLPATIIIVAWIKCTENLYSGSVALCRRVDTRTSSRSLLQMYKCHFWILDTTLVPSATAVTVVLESPLQIQETLSPSNCLPLPFLMIRRFLLAMRTKWILHFKSLHKLKARALLTRLIFQHLKDAKWKTLIFFIVWSSWKLSVFHSVLFYFGWVFFFFPFSAYLKMTGLFIPVTCSYADISFVFVSVSVP